MGLFKSKKERLYERCEEDFYKYYYELIYERRLLQIKVDKLNSIQSGRNKVQQSKIYDVDSRLVYYMDKWFTEHIPSNVLDEVFSSLPVKFEDERKGIRIVVEYYINNKGELSKFKDIIPTTIEEFNDPDIYQAYLNSKESRKIDMPEYTKYRNEYIEYKNKIDEYNEKVKDLMQEVFDQYGWEIEGQLRKQVKEDVENRVKSEGLLNG